MDDELFNMVNGDWNELSQLRYCGHLHFLAGVILVEGETTIIVNTIELYSRDIDINPHYERRLHEAATSFFPYTTRGRYGFIKICIKVTQVWIGGLLVGVRRYSMLLRFRRLAG